MEQVSFTKSRPVRLYAKLNKDGLDDDTAERCVNVREQENQVHSSTSLECSHLALCVGIHGLPSSAVVGEKLLRQTCLYVRYITGT